MKNLCIFIKKNINFLEDQICNSFVLTDNGKQCSSDLQWAPEENTISALHSRNALPQPPAATFALGCTSRAQHQSYSQISQVFGMLVHMGSVTAVSPPPKL